MKNLKKVLSLVLALAMAMSLMTTAFAAEDFGDADKITKTEAVEVMAALGILEGSNGNFDPQGTLTREQAAKIITYIVLGTTDAEKQPAAKAFDDVKTDRWSASYIAFCASEGYINGMGNNKFNPTGALTGYQFGKMLLCALGYDAEATGLVGDAWQINTGKYLVAEGLDENMDGVDMSKALTRENAAQLALNAMKWTDEGSVWQYTEGTGDTLKTYEFDTKSDAQIFYALSNDANKYWVGEVKTTEGSLLKEVYDVDATRGSDDFGRPANVYALNDKDDTVLTFADKADATFTGVTSEKAVYAALTAVKATSNVKTIDSIYEDGYAVSGTMNYGKNVTNNAAYFGNGITTELFKMTDSNGDNYYRLVAVRDYLAVVNHVTKADAKNDIERSIDVKLDVNAHGYSRNCAAYETENFEEDDVVVVNVSVKSGEAVVKSIQLAKQIENVAVTAYKKGGADKATLTAGGTTYAYSQTNNLETSTKNYEIGSSTTYTLTLDTMGNVLNAEVYSASASTNYVYVIQTQFQNKGSDLIDANAQAAKADVIFTDGTHKTINLAIDDKSTDAITDDTVMFPYVDGRVGELALSTILGADNANDKRTIGNWFAYTTNDDGTYNLEALSDTYAKVANNVTLHKDKSEALDGKYTTSATKVVTIDTDYTVTTTTGFATKDTTLSGKVLYTYTKDSKVVDTIYAVNAAAPETEVTYAYAVEAGAIVEHGTQWTFAINGEQVTYVISGNTAPVAGHVYTLKSAKNDTYKIDTDKLDTTSAGNVVEIEVVDNDMFISKAGTAYYFADSYGIYNIDDDDATVIGESDKIVAGDKVAVITKDNEVVAVYIVTAK